MFRRYRRYILGVVGGLAIFAIGAGTQRAAIWVDSPNTYPKYQESAEEARQRLPFLTLQQALQTAKYQQPCRNPQSSNASDLCAQWRAADAAERASRWAWWQMVFATVASFGLVITLLLQYSSWLQTRKTVKPKIVLSLGDFEKNIHGFLDCNLIATNIGQQGCVVTGTKISWFSDKPREGLVVTKAVPTGQTVAIRAISGNFDVSEQSRKLSVEVLIDGPFLETSEKTIIKRFNVFADLTYPIGVHYTDLPAT